MKTFEVVLDGDSMAPEILSQFEDANCRVVISDSALKRIEKSREILETHLESNKVIYGVNTGFGQLATTVINKIDIENLQTNVVRACACGVGQSLSPGTVRTILGLKIHTMLKGNSGVTSGLVQQLVRAFNAFVSPAVPEQGTVSCSGDLCPLGHIGIGLMGEASAWSPKTGWGPASQILEANDLTPLKWKAKEGLSFINGTQMVTAMISKALLRAELLTRSATVIGALTACALGADLKSFEPEVHGLRPHSGQRNIARMMHKLVTDDPNRETHKQDAYSIRCIPQVHGIVYDTNAFVRNIVQTELNSCTDNPVILLSSETIRSCGNFHGEYIAKAADYLTIAVHELAQISERRTERLVNPALSNGYPAFLVKSPGLNCGFMMPHVTAAALVSENKVLCHPSSCDSIPTSAGQEDHVAMGGFAVRKLGTVLDNVKSVLAIEAICAYQALHMNSVRKTQLTQEMQNFYSKIESLIRPLDEDRALSVDIQTVATLIENAGFDFDT